jgi:Holliday junction resolvasome RuvABC endonuclease subunit
MSDPRILGIDPGLEGGLAVYAPDTNDVSAIRVPVIGEGSKRYVDVNAMWAWLQMQRPTEAILERVGAMPGQGLSSTFRFGDANGSLRATVMLFGIPLFKAEPRVWKKALGLTKDGELSRQRAIEMFPQRASLFAFKKDHNLAEAALLAWYRARQARRAFV